EIERARDGRAVAAIVRFGADVPQPLRAEARCHVPEVVEAQVRDRPGERQRPAGEIRVLVERDSPDPARRSLAEQPAVVVADRPLAERQQQGALPPGAAQRPTLGEQGADGHAPIPAALTPAAARKLAGIALAEELAVIVADRSLGTGAEVE